MREHSGLLTDLYELTMAAGYFETTSTPGPRSSCLSGIFLRGGTT